MRTFLENMLRQVREFFARLQRKDKIRLGILAAVVIVLAVVVVAVLSRTNYVLLYAAESSAEAGEITEALREMGESYRIDGNKVLVPDGRHGDLRVRLAAQGVLDAEDFDRSYLNEAAGFNITSEHSKQLYEAQAGADIRTQLLQYDMLSNAMVTVNFGESSPYVITQGVKDATCAVVVTVRNGLRLTETQAGAIAETVRGNVPGIKNENIAISDSNMNLYPVTDGSTDINTEINSRIAIQNLLQQQFIAQGEQLLTPMLGIGNFQVTASVLLNYDKVLIEQIEFFPPIPGNEDGLIRSASELYESQRNRGAAGGVPGTDPNGMGTVEYPYVNLEENEEYRKGVFERNFELNETRTYIEREQGRVEKASISILINSEAVEEDYSNGIRNLISMGLGIPANNIAVEYAAFPGDGIDWEKVQADMDAYQMQLRRQEILQEVLRWAVILLLGLAFMSLIKAIVRAIKGPEPEELALEGGEYDYLIDDDYDELDEFDDVELNTKSTALEQIERFIDKDPAAVAQLLRNWLTDD